MTSILVVCTGNSCRSQMAEGWLNSLGRGSVRAASAGMVPTFVHPLAIRVMLEAGVDIAGHRSKSVEEFADGPIDILVTVCDHARQVCPVLPGRHRILHMPFDDPAAAAGAEEERLAVFRRVRDEIRAGMEELLRSIRAA